MNADYRNMVASKLMPTAHIREQLSGLTTPSAWENRLICSTENGKAELWFYV